MKKYRNYKVVPAPTPSFPSMVEVHMKKGGVKRFVTEEKAVVWIEAEMAEAAIAKGEKEAKEEMIVMGLIEE